jgi:hypothetical protein
MTNYSARVEHIQGFKLFFGKPKNLAFIGGTAD